VDERLKDLVAQIEKLQREVTAAGERESRLKEELSAALERAEQPAGQGLDDTAGRREERDAAQRWSESLEAELRLAREERDTRARNRLLELERARALNQRILELEEEKARRETEHRYELARLREQLDQQRKSCEAAGRILERAEEEARALVEEAQERARQLERQAVEDIFAKKQAAAQTLEGARAQVIRYLETFNITRDKLAATYNELDALVEQIPRCDSTIIELDHDGLRGSWRADTEPL